MGCGSSQATEDGSRAMVLWLVGPGDRKRVEARAGESVRKVRRRAERVAGYGVDTAEMVFADDVLDDGSSLEATGMEMDAEFRLMTQEWERFMLLWESNQHLEAVEVVIRKMVALNPNPSRHVDPNPPSMGWGDSCLEDRLRRGLFFNGEGRLASWNLSACGLEVLPEWFGSLQVSGRLDLSYNKLWRLPHSFGSLQAGGDLDMSYNNLESLPDSFGSLRVGGHLDLSHNKLRSLPQSLRNLQVRGDLNMMYNVLTAIPKLPGITGGMCAHVNGTLVARRVPEPDEMGALWYKQGVRAHMNGTLVAKRVPERDEMGALWYRQDGTSVLPWINPNNPNFDDY
eukprot:TRINITY_DN912_c0_g1_i31.p1 TRINITY_DN912_c0_g1~~TRINITY_DN912_c0_g1_i31.p1  ORF type:complete len:341 (-),score=50.48 TRINITY_DN912_c0_g1_i31:399-1421(-)